MANKSRPSSKDSKSSAGNRSGDKADSGSKSVNNVGQTKKGASLRRTADADVKPIKLGKSTDSASKKGSAQRPGAASKNKAPPEPNRWYSHWDYVLMEMKWMATDFMQERRWKMAAAAHISCKAAEHAVASGAAPTEGDVEMTDVKDEDKAPETQKQGGKKSKVAAVKEEPEDEAEATRAKDTKGKKGEAAPASDEEKGQSSEAGAPEAGNGPDGQTDDAAPQTNGDVKAPAYEYNPLDEVIVADGGLENRSGPPPWAADAPEWRTLYFLTAELQKAAHAKISEVDDKRALAQDLRYHEYKLDYEAALASVALAHQVAREEAQRAALAAELHAMQQAQAAAAQQQAQLLAEEEAKKNRRLKKKSKLGMDDGMEVDASGKKLVSMSSIAGAGSRMPLASMGSGALPPGMSAMQAGSLVRQGSKGDVADGKDGKRKDKKRKKSETADGADGDAAKKGGAGDSQKLEKKPSKKSKSKAAAEAAAEALRKAKNKGVPGDQLEWSQPEDQLLCAIVQEFGQNWALVADVFSNGTPVRGVYRRPEHCKARYRLLSTPKEDGTLHVVLQQLRMVKGASREIITNALPLPESVLVKQLTVLSAIHKRHQASLEEEKRRRAEANQQRHVPHPSHAQVELKMLQEYCGGKSVGPKQMVELSRQLDAAAAAQQQQALLLQQQQQAQQQQAAAAVQQPQQVAPASQQQQAGMQAAAAPGAIVPGTGTIAGAGGQQQAVVAPGSQAVQVVQAAPGAQVSLPTLPPQVQAAIQLKAQQQVAQVAQQRHLTPGQQQHLIAQLVARHTTTQQQLLAKKQAAQAAARKLPQGQPQPQPQQPVATQQPAQQPAVQVVQLGTAQQQALLLQQQQMAAAAQQQAQAAPASQPPQQQAAATMSPAQIGVAQQMLLQQQQQQQQQPQPQPQPGQGG